MEPVYPNNFDNKVASLLNLLYKLRRNNYYRSYRINVRPKINSIDLERFIKRCEILISVCEIWGPLSNSVFNDHNRARRKINILLD